MQVDNFVLIAIEQLNRQHLIYWNFDLNTYLSHLANKSDHVKLLSHLPIQVFNLGTCAACQASNMSKQQLYSTHMIPLLQYIKTKWPSISLLIWHDMLADYSVEELQPFGNLVEPMAWGYLDDIGNYFPPEMFSRFSQVFDNIWVASSYKGSSGTVNTSQK